MNQIKFDGHLHNLFFTPETVKDCSHSGQGYDDTIHECFCYKGSARISNTQNGDETFFNFVSVRSDLIFPFISRDLKCKDLLVVCEDSLRTAPLDLERCVDGKAIVDFLAEAVLETAKINKSNLAIPRIQMPVIGLELLRQKGWVAEPEGQITLVEREV